MKKRGRYGTTNVQDLRAIVVLLGAALAATIVMIAEDTEYPKKEVHKEELTDGDNEA